MTEVRYYLNDVLMLLFCEQHTMEEKEIIIEPTHIFTGDKWVLFYPPLMPGLRPILYEFGDVMKCKIINNNGKALHDQ